MATWTDGAAYAPTERPDGFATPEVEPLQPAPGEPPSTPGPGPSPQGFTADQQIPLEQVAAQPRTTRDPTQAFRTTHVLLAGEPEQHSRSRDPRTPFPQQASSVLGTGQSLPPPTGQPLPFLPGAQVPPPTGQPAPPPQTSNQWPTGDHQGQPPGQLPQQVRPGQPVAQQRPEQQQAGWRPPGPLQAPGPSQGSPPWGQPPGANQHEEPFWFGQEQDPTDRGRPPAQPTSTLRLLLLVATALFGIGIYLPGAAPLLIMIGGILTIRTKAVTGPLGTSATATGLGLMLFSSVLGTTLLSVIASVVFGVWGVVMLYRVQRQRQ